MNDTLPNHALLSRRQTLAATAAGGFVLAAGTVKAAAQANAPSAQAGPSAKAALAQASGRVFAADTNGGTGTGAGIAGVLVSNGQDVVKTDTDGRYALEIEDGQSIFIIKPRGWTTAVDAETQLPRTAYLYAPSGSPADLDFRFAGYRPTGPLPASIDFPLYPQDESDRFAAILFTDPQPESLAEIGYIRDDVVAQTAGVQAAFGITHGDIMFDDLSYYDRYNRIVGSIGLPWYNLPGNHDMNLEAPDNVHSRDTFKRVFGARYGAFQYGGATFFHLDNVDYLGTDPERPLGFGKYRGFFGERQLAFVRNVLAAVPADALVVYSFHIPLRTLFGTEPSVQTVDTKDFLAAISSHPNSVSFSGHTHTNEHWYLGAAEGWTGSGTHHHRVLAAVSGSWWSGPLDERGIPIALQSDGAPNGFHILTVDGNRFQTTLMPARDPARSQIRIALDSQAHGDAPELLHEFQPGALLTGPVARAATGATRVVVNLFDGGPRSNVTMAVGRSAEFIPMRKVSRIDPFVAEIYTRHASVTKPWVVAGRSSHIWQATLPADMAPGSHRLTIQATDEFGRPHVAWMILEVTA